MYKKFQATEMKNGMWTVSTVRGQIFMGKDGQASIFTNDVEYHTAAEAQEVANGFNGVIENEEENEG